MLVLTPEEVVDIQICCESAKEINICMESGESTKFFLARAEAIDSHQASPCGTISDISAPKPRVKKPSTFTLFPNPTDGEELKASDIDLSCHLTETFTQQFLGVGLMKMLPANVKSLDQSTFSKLARVTKAGAGFTKCFFFKSRLIGTKTVLDLFKMGFCTYATFVTPAH